ncbi:MAG TPA: hypothetical protein DCE25_09765, partial [Pseudomonas sp.]|nr:hypothetical protein [Pseudomonas sp.]
MLDERPAQRPVDFDQSIDDAWLNRCAITQLAQEGELAYFRLLDRDTGHSWIAVRAPLELPAACQRLERDYRLQLDPQWAVLPSAFVRSAEGPLLVYPGGRSIADLLDHGPAELTPFFEIALNAANALA